MFVSEKIVLEPAARRWADMTARPPYLYEMEPAAARKVLDDVTTVRYDGVIHDFMMLNALSGTQAARAAIGQASAILRAAFDTA